MTTLSGLKIEDTVIGTGAVAVRGAIVLVEWRGWLNQGDEFGRGVQSFCVGKRQVIAGMEKGVEQMRVGGIRKLRISPHLAYRDESVPGIPPNAVLHFELKLLEVNGSSDTTVAQ
jgi:FKBP-type peptidyl-prolyl cis-trans isomerase